MLKQKTIQTVSNVFAKLEPLDFYQKSKVHKNLFLQSLYYEFFEQKKDKELDKSLTDQFLKISQTQEKSDEFSGDEDEESSETQTRVIRLESSDYIF
jgi:hypothetical protein